MKTYYLAPAAVLEAGNERLIYLGERRFLVASFSHRGDWHTVDFSAGTCSCEHGRSQDTWRADCHHVKVARVALQLIEGEVWEDQNAH